MNNLFQVFSRFSGSILFFILEFISFFLIITFNNDQQKVYLQNTANFTGYVQKKITNTKRLFSLYDEIEALKLENVGLRQQLDNANYTLQFDSLTKWNEDSSLQVYNFIPANIVSKNFSGINNTLIIDKGSQQGIRKHMGVISDNGPIGVITAISKHYSRVMCLQHPQAAISATIKNNNYFGTLVWDSDDYAQAKLKDIPIHVPINKNDTILTSGYSNIFPKDILIGTIEKIVKPKGSGFYDINVQLNANVLKLSNVYIVQNLMSEEINQLKQEESE